MASNPSQVIEEKERLGAEIPLSYPLELGSVEEKHFVTFDIFKYNKPKIDAFDNKELLNSILLPMPPKLVYADAHNYEEFSAAIVGNVYNAIAGEGDLKDRAAGIFTAGLKTLSNAGLSESANLAQAQAGKSINPRNTNVYTSPKMREFSFDYSLVARNFDESIAIRKIIDAFRFHSYPDGLLDQAVFDAPEIFSISYKTAVEEDGFILFKDNEYLPKPLPAALIAINTDYYSYGDPSFFRRSNAPVEIKLSLVFREMEIDYKQKLLDRYYK